MGTGMAYQGSGSPQAEGSGVVVPSARRLGAIGSPQTGDWGVGSSAGSREAWRHSPVRGPEGCGSFRQQGASIRVPSDGPGWSRQEGWRWNHRLLKPGLCSHAANPGEVGHRVERGAAASRGQQSSRAVQRPLARRRR